MEYFEGQIGNGAYGVDTPYTLRVEYTYTQSVAENYSNVSVKAFIKRNDRRFYPYNDNAYGKLTVDGSVNEGRVSFDLRSDGFKEVMSHSKTVYHNNDGTKSITIRFDFNGNVPSANPNGYIERTVALDRIARAPSYNSIDATSILEYSVYLSSSIETHGLEITGGGWDISTDGGNTWTYYDGGVTGRSITGLTPNTQYWYRGYCVTAGGSINSSWGTFTTLNRRANITSFSVSKRDETSVQFSWSADASCDWAWYSTDGGNNWNNLPNSNIIGGLSANTWYAFKLRVRRTDSGLTKDSDVVWQQTYDYPHLEYASNFTIGENINVNIYNPLNRWMDIYFIGNDNSTICTASRNNNGSTSIGNTAQEIDSQYASIPNSNVGNYKVRLVVSSLSRDTTVNGAEYRTNTDNCKPTFSDFSFEDINTTTLALTGNNQNIINRYSNVKAIITTLNKATAQKYATMSKYSFVCGNSQTNINYSNSETVEGIINGAKSGVFNVYAIDSRTNSTVVTKIANEFIEYNDLIKNSINVSRQNGVSEITSLLIYGKVDLVDFGQVVNSIKSAKYRYKATDSNTWSNYTNITLTVDNNGNFLFNGNIQGDTNDGFDIDNSYKIEVVVSDELSTITFTANLGSGVPNIALHKNGVGIMGKYDTSVGGLFQIEGKDIFKLSSSEFFTGYKWIDGKKIYGKVFTGNITDTTNEWVNLQKCDLANVDNIINISGTIKNTSSDRRVLSTDAYESTSYHCTFSYLGQTDYLQCFVNGWTYTTFGFKYIVIIEYTKTTD